MDNGDLIFWWNITAAGHPPQKKNEQSLRLSDCKQVNLVISQLWSRDHEWLINNISQESETNKNRVTKGSEFQVRQKHPTRAQYTPHHCSDPGSVSISRMHSATLGHSQWLFSLTNEGKESEASTQFQLRIQFLSNHLSIKMIFLYFPPVGELQQQRPGQREVCLVYQLTEIYPGKLILCVTPHQDNEKRINWQ